MNKAYGRYALEVRFHVDACQPRAPQAKGKVERRIRDKRLGIDPRRRHWNDLAELQQLSDVRVLDSANGCTSAAKGHAYAESRMRVSALAGRILAATVS